MEGVSHEACALAGTLGLGKLIMLYDDNLISLDGPTELSYNDDVLERFKAYHWHTQRVADGNDLNALEAAIAAAKAETGKPSLIAVRTVIGYGSPKAGTNKVHGEALGAADTAATKKFFGFPEDQSFYVPDDALKNWRKAVDRGATAGSGVEQTFRRGMQRSFRNWRWSLTAHRREFAGRVGRRRFPALRPTRSRQRAMRAGQS